MRMRNQLEQNSNMLDTYKRLGKVEFSSQLATFLVKILISSEKYWLSTFTKGPQRQDAARWGFLLQNMVGSPEIPFLYCGGRMNESQVFPLKQKLGPTLHQLMQQTAQKRFSISTVCNIAHQTLILLESLHEKYFIVNRFLLDNFRVGSGKNIALVYFANILHCLEYCSTNTCSQVDFQSPFMSENQLKNMRCSRRDNMFLWLMMLVYFLKGSLPQLNWDNNNMVLNKNRMKQMFSCQQGMKKLFAATKFSKIYEHIKDLDFEERSNYKYLKLQLDLIMAHDKNDAGVLDWLKSNPKRQAVPRFVLKDTLIDDRDKHAIDALLERYGKNVELDEIQERHKQKYSLLYENSKQ